MITSVRNLATKVLITISRDRDRADRADSEDRGGQRVQV